METDTLAEAENNGTPLTGVEAINVAAEEYRELQNEKHLYEQAVFGITTLFVLGSVGALTAMVHAEREADRLILMLVLPFGQLALLLLILYLLSMSLRFSMYLAEVEKRIERLAGRKLVRWEGYGTEGAWPGSHTLSSDVGNDSGGSTSSILWPTDPITRV